MANKQRNVFLIIVLIVGLFFMANQTLFSSTTSSMSCSGLFQEWRNDGLLIPEDATLSLVPFKEFCVLDIGSSGLEYKLVYKMSSGVSSGSCQYYYNLVEQSECPTSASTGDGISDTNGNGGFDFFGISPMILLIIGGFIIVLVLVKK